MELTGTKSIFKSKGMIWSIVGTVIGVIAIFGINLDVADFKTIIASSVAVVGPAVLMWKRFTQTVKGLNIVTGITTLLTVLGAIYTSTTGDSEAVETITPMIAGIATALTTILAAFGINVAKEKVEL